MSPRTALIAGAAGLGGRHCLVGLLAEPAYGRVTSLVRRDPGREHLRLDTRVVDFGALGDTVVSAADDVYLALGTTMRQAGSPQAFRRDDHDYVVDVAPGPRGRATRPALVSSIGADPDARTLYPRVKGEVERRTGPDVGPTAD